MTCTKCGAKKVETRSIGHQADVCAFCLLALANRPRKVSCHPGSFIFITPSSKRWAEAATAKAIAAGQTPRSGEDGRQKQPLVTTN